MKKAQYIIISAFIISFITIYGLLIYFIYVLPIGLEFPIVIFTGFSLIIIAYFYLFFKLIDSDNKIYSFHFKGISEALLKILLIFIMLITFLIPPINFSEISIDWNQISFLNYLRGIIYIFGCAYIPGSCIFNLFFSKSNFYEKLNIEPFFIKIIFYPLISFTFLGSATLILDHIGLYKGYFPIVLICIIFFLFFVELLFQRYHQKNNKFFNRYEVEVSKFTLFILLIAGVIIIISFGILTNVKYILVKSQFVSIKYSFFIGNHEPYLYDGFYNYTKYWSYIAFSLASLTGIPILNTTIMLSPFIYLFILSLFLFFKVFLQGINEKYAILATLLAITFSSLFDIYNSISQKGLISWFVFSGLINFQYKGFAIILFMSSMTLFTSIIKNQVSKKIELNEIKLIILSAFLLIQSFLIYYLPLIPAILLILIFFFFSEKNELLFKKYLLFITMLISFFIFFDLIFNFFISFIIVYLIDYFINISFFIAFLPQGIMILVNALLLYSLLIGLVLLNFIIFKLYKRGYGKKINHHKKLKFSSIIAFRVLITIFTELLILEIIGYYIFALNEHIFFIFILNLLIFNIGFIGILSIYLCYYCFKKSHQIFYISFIWTCFILISSLLVILVKWLQYPGLNLILIKYGEHRNMVYWFTRIWYYSIIPLSVFCSIGLIYLKKYLGLKISKRKLNMSTSIPLKLLLVSSFIIITLSNTMVAGISYYNGTKSTINDEEAQMIGWITKNTYQKSQILVDREIFLKLIKSDLLRSSYRIDYEIEQAFSSYNMWDIEKNFDHNCSVELLDETNDFKNVIKLIDQNSNGRGSILIKSNVTRNFGEINFYLKISNKSKMFWINFTSPENITTISFASYINAFNFYNGTNFIKLINIKNQVWYQIKLIFECSNGSYLGLNEYQWKVMINGTELGRFNFLNNKSINNMYLSTSAVDSDYSVYINKIIFSWAPTIKTEYGIFPYLIVFDHLKNNNITYFIFSEVETKYNKRAELFIDIKGDLISKFYKYKLYGYKDLSLYSIGI